MDGFTTIEVTADGPVGSITLARPGQRNAMDATMLRELVAAADLLDTADDVRCVVVRGQGESFSAGADLSLLEGLDGAEDPRARADLGRRMADAIERMRPLAIAAIHGWCVGGAVVLAAACDLRVATADARFSLPEVDLGIPLAWGGVPRLVREIGPALTKELVITCRPFGADEAQRAGFLNRVVAPEQLDGEVDELATVVASKARVAVEATTRHTDAVTRQMVGLDHGWADADGLLVAMQDDEAAGRRADYLAARRG